MTKKVYFDLEEMVNEFIGCDVKFEFNYSNSLTFIKDNARLNVKLEFNRYAYLNVDYSENEESEIELNYYVFIKDNYTAIKGAEIQTFCELIEQLKEIKDILS